MILHSLEVQNFRALREVRLTFGRGLNILYGPNDIGKSSLAEALRVAFLLPATSKAGEEFTPWGTDDVPCVVVKFEMNDVVWQLTKKFRSGGKGTALLERVEKGTFFKETGGKNVEVQLREILSWGVASGGKGLPESYLATALLGWQDKVTAILDASPEMDGDTSGLKLVTTALGTLGQDHLVCQLLQRLQERTEMVFTESGQLRRAGNSPLVRLTNRVDEQQQRLHQLDEGMCRSAEIERRVQCLTADRIRAAEECARLERRVELLRMVNRAEIELACVRGRERSIEEARRTLAETVTNLADAEATREQATSAHQKVEKDLQTARERLAKLSGSLEKARENAQQAREAKRAELIARRDAAARQVQDAQVVIQAQRELQDRQQAFTAAKRDHQQAQQAELCARNLAELAGILAEQRRANAVVNAWTVARTGLGEAETCVSAADHDLKEAEAALQAAEKVARLQVDARARAQWEAAERDRCEATLRTSLIQAESAEREALQDAARARAAIACCERLVEAEQSLTDLEAHERDLAANLDQNTANRRACEARMTAPMPLPIQPGLLAGLLVGALAAALGIALQIPADVLAVAIGVSGLLAAVMTAFGFRHFRQRGAIQVLRQGLDDLANSREALVGRRNQVLATCGAVRERVARERLEWNRAEEMMGDPVGALDYANARLEQASSETERIRKKLATLEGHQPKPDAVSPADVEAAERKVQLLKGQVNEKKSTVEEACRRHLEADVNFKAASSAAASVDLAGIEQQIYKARSKTRGEVVPDPDEAQVRLRVARETLAQCETAMRIAEERLSDAKSSFNRMADALGQPPEQVLAEAEKNRIDADKALEGLKETFSAGVAAAEKELQDAQADVERLGKAATEAQVAANDATRACNQAWTNREQAQARLNALLTSPSTASLTDAEAALADARRELESHSGGSTSLPDNLTAVAVLLEQQQAELRRTENELEQARGQLELVGGTVLRDQRDQESQSLECLRRSANDLELELHATRRLLNVLREEEAQHAAHLGRSLANPVTDLFSEFTSGRYPQIVLNPGLSFQSVMARGGERELESLSVGTRDQLATVIRLALAACLRSAIVLDDQLVQSDPQRLAWFRNRLRENSGVHQIIVITCRPLDYLDRNEMPDPPCSSVQSGDGMLNVVDLGQLLAPSECPSSRDDGDRAGLTRDA